MSLFTLNKNNLGDLDDLKKARKNLGLGTIALQESNNVNIDGGHIAIKNFKLTNRYEESHALIEGMFMVSDQNGYAYWREYDSVRENKNLRLSGFCNDVPFASLYEVNQCLKADNNLSDVTDVGKAISNLGLASLLEENDDGSLDPVAYRDLKNAKALNFRTSNLIVTGDVEIQSRIRLPFLNEYANLSSANMLRLDTTSNTIEVITISSNITDNDEKQVPSSALLHNIYNELSNVTYVAFQNIDAKMDRITAGSNYLEQMNNLSDLSDKNAALSNLGLMDITTIDNVLTTTNLHITDNFRFGNDTNIPEGYVLLSDSIGNGTWGSIPAATNSVRGSVNIANSFYQQDQLGKVFVPTSSILFDAYNTLSNTINDTKPRLVSELENDAKYLSKNTYLSEFTTDLEKDLVLNNLSIHKKHIQDFPTKLSSFSNDEGYLKIGNRLSEFEEAQLSEIRTNLGLSEVASNGDFYSLKNLPAHLVDNAEMDRTYFVKSQNLGDIENLSEVQSNIGLREMAFYDRNNVLITGGNITGLNSITTDELRILPPFDSSFTDQNFIDDIIFLKATSANGEGKWSRIPNSTETSYGLVKISKDLSTTGDDIIYTSTFVKQELDNIDTRINNAVGTLTDDLSSRINTNSANITTNSANITTMNEQITELVANQNDGTSLILRETLSVGGIAKISGGLNVNNTITATGSITSSDNITASKKITANDGFTVSDGIANFINCTDVKFPTEITLTNANITTAGITTANITNANVSNKLITKDLHVSGEVSGNIKVGDPTIIENLYYRKDTTTVDSDSVKVMVLENTGELATWKSAKDINELKFVHAVNRNVKSLTIDNLIEFHDDIDDDDRVNRRLRDKSILISDDQGKMHWNSNVRVTEQSDGLIFNESMTIVEEGDKIIIGKYSSNATDGVEVIKKHIFR